MQTICVLTIFRLSKGQMVQLKGGAIFWVIFCLFWASGFFGAAEGRCYFLLFWDRQPHRQRKCFQKTPPTHPPTHPYSLQLTLLADAGLRHRARRFAMDRPSMTQRDPVLFSMSPRYVFFKTFSKASIFITHTPFHSKIPEGRFRQQSVHAAVERACTVDGRGAGRGKTP